MARRAKAGLWSYLSQAFLFRWNLLFALGGAAAAALSPAPEVFLPLIGAVELAYLAGVTSIPKFRSAIDAKTHAAGQGIPLNAGSNPQKTLQALLTGLDSVSLRRFEALRRRCLDMHSIARGVGGRAGGRGQRKEEQLTNPGLDRLLWTFLRMLSSRTSLERFLDSTDEDSIRQKLAETRVQLTEAETAVDERLIRSLRDSLATREMQLDNYQKAQSNATFVAVELDRLEAKIQTLSELSVNRQDPDFISREVDSVAASIQHTEEAMEELHLVDGLLDDLEEPPAILGARMKEIE